MRATTDRQPRHLRTVCVSACFLVSAVTISLAQNSTNVASSSPAAGFDQWSDDLKHPVDWFNWGADMRVRNEYFDNIITLNSQAAAHEQDVIRYRGRVWGSVQPADGLSLNTRLSAEPREWFMPAFAGTYSRRTGMEWRYGIFDLLNVKYTNNWAGPLVLAAGRQDMAFGEYWNWWLVADGTPGDGSWSFFLDSVRLTYGLPDVTTKLDAIYIYQQARPDEWIPTLGRSHDCYLTEQNEQGVILYASNQSFQPAQVDGFFIYKRDDRELSIGDEANLYTVGGRVIGTPVPHWQYSAEGAYQFGNKEDAARAGVDAPLVRRDRTLDAFGANARLSYLFRDRLKNTVTLSFEFLSGDNPNTGDKDEMFDILWGRWPRFSEGYIYSYILETGGRVAQLNNIERLGAGWSFEPLKGLTCSTVYNAWFAPESAPTRNLNPALFTGDGHFRGHYLQAVLKYQLGKHFTAHLWNEFIWAGDYYQQRSLLDFIRAEMAFSF